jgi:tRNA pseudouridine55 synthase
MDGKPLYEYARENKPLPRPIEARLCTVHELVLESWIPAVTSPEDTVGHQFSWPDKEIDDEQREARERVAELVLKAEAEAHSTEAQLTEAQLNIKIAPQQATPEPKVEDGTSIPGPPAFVLRMSVSSGTYVRSIVHDIGLALGSAAHVVTLTRTRQGKYGLAGASRLASIETEAQAPVPVEVERPDLMDGDCIKWEVFERALEKLEGGNDITAKSEANVEGEWEDWEQAIIQSWSEK